MLIFLASDTKYNDYCNFLLDIDVAYDAFLMCLFYFHLQK
jgi:hypothetical protein